jgi:hypothetical protein
VLSVDWHPAHAPTTWSLEVGDRRRALPSLEILEFARRSVTLTAATSSDRAAASLGVSIQPYRAETASGRRFVVSAEAARFARSGVLSARYAFVTPWADRINPYAGNEYGELGEFGDIDRADFLEQLSLEGSDTAFGTQALSLDPVETDSDDWDFGRRTHVLVGYLSRRLQGNAVLSGSVRYQYRTGPNLLALPGSPSAAAFTDNRLGLRLTFRQPLTKRLVGVAQASGLRNSSARPAANFSRALIGVGLQIQLGRLR